MASDQPYAAMTLAQELESTSLGIAKETLEKIEPGLDALAIEKNITQRLCTFALHQSIFPNLTLMIDGRAQPAAVALPPSWRRKLQNLGIPIRPYSSAFLWVICLLKMYLAGTVRAFRLLAWTWTTDVKTPEDPYSVIYVPSSDMVSGDPGPENFDFLSTFLASPAHQPDERTTWIVLNGVAQAHPPNTSISTYGLPKLSSFRDQVIFSIHVLVTAVTDAIHIAMGAWWRAILQDERIMFRYVRSLNPDDLASSYVFTSANLLVRPLWTYVPQASGSRVMLTFISTNIYTFSPSKHEKSPISVGLKSMTWPIYSVWNKAQRNYLRHAGHTHAKFIVMGAIGYGENPRKSYVLPENTIVLFDVAPIRDSLLAERGWPNPYYIKSAWRTIEDIISVSKNIGVNVALKSKARSDKYISREYLNFIAKLHASGDLHIIPPDISAHRVINQSRCIISAPFTSTAFIAKSLGKPSIYYDPLGVLFDKSELSDNVSIVCGITDLRSWLSAELLNAGLQE